MTGFRQRYGPWALVAGASEGIGAAFATALAGRGVDLVLVARRPGPLNALADRLPVQTLTLAADLATTSGLAAVEQATQDLEVGLVVVNAAYSPIGRLIDQDPAQTQRALDLNCRTPLLLAHRYLPVMAARGRGGLIIMSSLAGLQGTPSLATYAATKAFGAVLAEGLWAELRGTGVDVLTCVPGAVATPGLDATMGRPAPGTLVPDRVAATALQALGRRPRTVPGTLMRISAALMTRLLPRRAAIALIAGASRDLSAPPQPAIEASTEPAPSRLTVRRRLRPPLRRLDPDHRRDEPAPHLSPPLTHGPAAAGPPTGSAKDFRKEAWSTPDLGSSRASTIRWMQHWVTATATLTLHRLRGSRISMVFS